MALANGRRVVLSVAACAALALTPSTAEAAKPRACNPVVNPYPNTRYEGANLSRIRATRVSCPGARRVARGAHRKALGLTVPSSGVRRFTWRGWKVTGDIRGATDRYAARKGKRRVTWRF